jgi:hypothetical protein
MDGTLPDDPFEGAIPMAPPMNPSGKRAGQPPTPVGDTRAVITVSTDEPRVVDEAIAALVSTEAPIFQRGGMLVRVTRDESAITGAARPKHAPVITPVPLPRLRELLAGAAVWMCSRRVGGEPRLVPAHPPEWVVREVAARGEWTGIRSLRCLVEVPVLRPDGTVLDRRGYDPATGLLYEPGGVVVAVPDSPTQGDARAACDALLEVVEDFPFAAATHRSAWLAALLSLFGRYAIDGPTPLTLFEASVLGSGKTLLARVIARLVTGREPYLIPEATDPDEERKRITSIAIQGDSLVVVDNVRALGSAALDAALTASSWQDRILGASQTVRLPLHTVWLATGNNVVLRGDVGRRVSLCRLEPAVERPEARRDFRHPDLIGWVGQHRARLVAATLTMLRAYCVAGRPGMHLTPWGSYEAWSELVRGAIVFVGQPDPHGARDQLSEADAETTAIAALLAGWTELAAGHGDPGHALTSRQALQLLEGAPADRYATLRDALADLTRAPAGKLPTPHQLGLVLRRHRGRVCGGRRLDAVQGHARQRGWVVTMVTTGDDATALRGGDPDGSSGARDIVTDHHHRHHGAEDDYVI